LHSFLSVCFGVTVV